MFEVAKAPTAISVRSDGLYVALISIFATAIRIAFWARGLGTDEIVYISQAYHLLDAEFPRASCLGAVRYGINGLQALSIRLFGNGVAGAEALFFVCSIAGVLLAYRFAHHLWGRRSAIWAALSLAALPLDVTLAGSLNPDPYLGLFVTASIVAFYLAEETDHAKL